MPSDWLWESWVANRNDIVPLATFFLQFATLIGAGLVAWAALAQAKTARRRHDAQTTADRERRITESFAKAVEQLGSDKLETCLGGIYTLEQISKEKEGGRELYWPIMETLTAFVRERAKPETKKASVRVRPRTEIQAALTVLGFLGRRNEAERKQDQAAGRCLDLAETDLRGARLVGAHFESADLREALLSDADLREAHFEGAFLGEAHLVSAHLEHADLREAHFEGAFLMMAHLEHADLRGAHLERASLWMAHLEHADLTGAHLKNASFKRRTDLTGTKGLTQEQLNSAEGDEETVPPAHLTRPAHWSSSPENAQPDAPDNPE